MTNSEPTQIEEIPYASLSERFAALLIDLTALCYMSFPGYKWLAERLGQPAGDIAGWNPASQKTLIIASLTSVFFYFFLFEGIFARTPGKILGRLAVTNTNGSPPSILGVFIRNLVRFIDIILFPLAGLGLAETTKKSQRLGDLLAGTTVVRSCSPKPSVLPFDSIQPGSVTRRSVAFILDLAIFITTALFFLAILPSNRPPLVEPILMAGPLLAIVYWVAFEKFFGGTPAKLIMGLRVTDEEGRPVRIPASVLRNLARIADHNPLGYLCAILSSRKQRPGDLASETMVIRYPLTIWRFFTFLIVASLAAGLVFYGINNPENFIRNGYRVKVGPWTLSDLPGNIKYHFGYKLKIHSVSSSKESYLVGEIAYLATNISGFIVKDGNAWLQQDLLITDSGGGSVLDLLNVINRRFDVEDSNTQKLIVSFIVPTSLDPGTYNVRVRVRDQHGEMTAVSEARLVIGNH